jgi:hypothetical protein
MKSEDFLFRNASTPLHRRFMAAGAVCALETNFEPVLEAAQEVFLPVPFPTRISDFSLRLWVDCESRTEPPWPKPYVRALDHLVFAGFDSDCSLLVDLSKRRVLGRFSMNMASDRDHWRAVIFPVLMSVVAASVGVAELHCSCVAKNGKGYLLAGPSRSGKSTLTFALAHTGFAFLSDDRTFCSIEAERLSAWGLAASLKLRQEAQAWFEELTRRQPTGVENGESILRFDPENQFGLERAKFCEPQCLIFLDQREEPQFRLREMSEQDAARRLDQELMAEPAALLEKQRKVVERLVFIPCWQLQYGGDPGVIAPKLASHFERVSSGVSACR